MLGIFPSRGWPVLEIPCVFACSAGAAAAAAAAVAVRRAASSRAARS